MRYEDTKKSRIINKMIYLMKIAIIPIVIALVLIFFALMIYMAIWDNFGIFWVIVKIGGALLLSLFISLIGIPILKLVENVMYVVCGNNTKKYFYDTPIKATLMSITADINVFDDISKCGNIEKAKKNAVEDIIVMKTYLEDNYRELVTGKILHDVSLNESLGVIIKSDTVTSKELEEYINSHTKERYKDGMSFDEYLDYLEKSAEEYYAQSAENKKLTEKGKINKILEDYFKAKNI